VRILIANRGEIARRVIRTAHGLGHETVAVFTGPDARGPFVREASHSVRIDDGGPVQSYLSIEAILDAATTTGADAVHPGYGFLSENPDFAEAVIGAGLVWIGPHPSAIRAMGSKIEARRIAADAGVNTIPGFAESQDSRILAEAADRIGFPVLVKASSGGGGKGIRIVHEAGDFPEALASAKDEALRSFADDRVIVERYVTRPRHVEVQLIGDRHGTVAHLGTRECSVQRRYQKVLEEAPAPNLDPATREGLHQAGVALAKAIDYDSAGTVEFIVDDDSGEFFFLEMNTRLQVEHPVTEFVTGLDLVELQIRSAMNEPLAIGDVTVRGHAFEARVNAEDAWAGFAPQIGVVTDIVVPEGARWDSGIEPGNEVTSHFDPMVAKLIVGGPDRETARLKLTRALEETLIGGLVTNLGFHRWLIDQPAVVAGRVTTRFLEETDLPPPPDEHMAAVEAAGHWVAAQDRRPGSSPWQSLRQFRVTPHAPKRVVYLQGRESHDIEVTSTDPPSLGVVDGRRVVVGIAGHSFTFTVLTPSERWAPAQTGAHGTATTVAAPFPGVVAEVRVDAGQDVSAGEILIVVEAMKMLHPVLAPGAGTVDEVRVRPGDRIVGNQILVTFKEQE
jgi:acetyl/propionyl-CoA carboxylase alpha subunit